MSLVKYNNNSISAITTAGQLATGSLVPISEQTASGSASISFTSGIDSTYPIYRFEFINIHGTVDTDFQFQGSINGGSSYGVTITSTSHRAYHNESDTATALQYQAGSDLAQSTSYQHLSECGTANDMNTSGSLLLFNPSSTTFVKHWISNFNFVNDSNYSINIYHAGYFNTTNSINALTFRMSSGNIDAGTIKLYGIKDS